MELSYGIEKVFNEVIPKLQHGNDGLIYTCLQSPYVVGTDPKMYVSFISPASRPDVITGEQIKVEAAFREYD